jgi:hypothetical protein
MAMTEAPEDDPVSSDPDDTWERYVVTDQDSGWRLRFDGKLDHLPPPSQAPSLEL